MENKQPKYEVISNTPNWSNVEFSKLHKFLSEKYKINEEDMRGIMVTVAFWAYDNPKGLANG